MKAKGGAIILIAALFVFLAAGCAFRDGGRPGGADKQPCAAPSEEPGRDPLTEEGGSRETGEEDAIEGILAGMTLREKVGQLFIVRPNAIYEIATGDDDGNALVTELTDPMREALTRYPVGGVAMFWQNISDPEQITAFIDDLQSASEIPLFIALDEEGGLVARLANNGAFHLPKYESAAAVALEGDPEAAAEMGRTIGAYLIRYGFNMDFAPVSDVNTNPDNSVIGDRSFSTDPVIAAAMAAAMADGLRQEGIIPTFKHFPGHGDTAQDSHVGTAVSLKTREEMEICEWVPFLEAGDDDCVMVGHISAPNITGNGLPATLSYQLVTGILRKSLGFEGLIITDALEMGAITGEYGCGTAAVMAFKAGSDILLMPEDLDEAIDAILSAVESGEISVERVDASVRRILTFKAAYMGL